MDNLETWPHGVYTTKKNKTKTQYNMCWTPNKHKQRKQDMRIPTITDKVVLGTPFNVGNLIIS